MHKIIIMVNNTAQSGTNITKTPEELKKEFENLKKIGIVNLNTVDRKRFLELAKQFNTTPNKSIDDLKKDLENAYNSGDFDTAEKINQEIEKLEQQTVEAPEIDNIDEIKNIIKSLRTKKEKKEKMMQLLDSHQRKEQEKIKNLGKKPQDKMLQSMYDKLLDFDENFKKPDLNQKIGKAKTTTLPFIPLFRLSKANEELKKQWVVSFSLWEVEILNYSWRKRRNRMNRVSNNLNDIGDDSEKAIRYLFNMSEKRHGWRVWALIKQSFRSWLDAKKLMKRDPEKFNQILEKKRNLYLASITEGVEKEEEKEVMKSIKERFEYHIRNYRLQESQKWLLN